MKHQYKNVLLLAAIVGINSTGSANVIYDTYNLADLISSGESVRAGDKVFSGFSWTTIAGNNALSTITVSTIMSVDGLYGIEIGGALSQLGIGSSDWRLGYSVTADPGNLISDIHQYASLSGTAGSYINITENALDSGQHVVATSNLGQGINYAYIDQSDPYAELNDKLNVDTPLSTLYISKDILLQVTDANGDAATTIIDQTFSQTPVPEPSTIVAGTLLVLPFALSALQILRKKLHEVKG